MESLRHWKAKLFLQKFLMQHNYSLVIDEFALDTINTLLGERDYTVDLLAEKEGKRYAFEVDGKKGHSTKCDLIKMKLRDESLKLIGIKTVRLKTDDLIGRRKQTPELILQEIEYQLK